MSPRLPQERRTAPAQVHAYPRPSTGRSGAARTPGLGHVTDPLAPSQWHATPPASGEARLALALIQDVALVLRRGPTGARTAGEKRVRQLYDRTRQWLDDPDAILPLTTCAALLDLDPTWLRAKLAAPGPPRRIHRVARGITRRR